MHIQYFSHWLHPFHRCRKRKRTILSFSIFLVSVGKPQKRKFEIRKVKLLAVPSSLQNWLLKKKTIYIEYKVVQQKENEKATSGFFFNFRNDIYIFIFYYFLFLFLTILQCLYNRSKFSICVLLFTCKNFSAHKLSISKKKKKKME